MLWVSVIGRVSTMTRKLTTMLLIACPGLPASIGRLRWPTGWEGALGVVIVAGGVGCAGGTRVVWNRGA